MIGYIRVFKPEMKYREFLIVGPDERGTTQMIGLSYFKMADSDSQVLHGWI